MAQTTLSDFKIYEEQFYAGMNEWLQQNSDIFNAASMGAIRFVTNQRKGQYEQESFFKHISSLIVRRDVTSTSSVTDKKLEQDELVRVKINRRIGPVAVNKDAFRKVGMDPDMFSFVLGQQIAPDIQVDYANTAIASVAAAIRGQSSLVKDRVSATQAQTLRHTYLAEALAKLGDASGRIVCWVMHSKPFYDLVSQSITDNVFEVGGVVVKTGMPATLGKPVIVTDSSSLVETSGSSASSYITLGLTSDAVVIEQSEDQEIVSQLLTGTENIGVRIQGEHSFNVGCKGFAWDMTNGGANPTDAALATSTNWDLKVHDVKLGPGVILLSD